MADEWTIWATGHGKDAPGGKLHWGMVGYGTECGITTGMYVTDSTDMQEAMKAGRNAELPGPYPCPGCGAKNPGQKMAD